MEEAQRSMGGPKKYGRGPKKYGWPKKSMGGVQRSMAGAQRSMGGAQRSMAMAQVSMGENSRFFFSSENTTALSQTDLILLSLTTNLI